MPLRCELQLAAYKIHHYKMYAAKAPNRVHCLFSMLNIEMYIFTKWLLIIYLMFIIFYNLSSFSREPLLNNYNVVSYTLRSNV